MKKGMVISALIGFTGGTIIGVMSTSKKAKSLRKKIFQNINKSVHEIEGKLKRLISFDKKHKSQLTNPDNQISTKKGRVKNTSELTS